MTAVLSRSLMPTRTKQKQKKKVIRLQFAWGSRHAQVAFFPGTEDEALTLAIKASCGLAPNDEIVAKSTDGVVHVAIAEAIPDGMELEIINVSQPMEKVIQSDDTDISVKGISDATSMGNDSPDNEVTPLLNLGVDSGMSGNSGGNDDDDITNKQDFQGQLLKFERINAHLANERTYLAWARTVMSIMTVAFALKSEALSSFDDFWSITWFISSVLFLSLANYVWYNGWHRYVRVKDICLMVDLKLAEKQMAEDGAGFRLLWVLTMALGSLLGALAVLYVWYGSSDEVRLYRLRP